MEDIETARPRDASAASLDVRATIIAKIGEWPGDTYSYFSKNGIETNIRKDMVVPIIFGIDGTDRDPNGFYAAGYKNEGFIDLANSDREISNERICAIKKFDDGIVVSDDGKKLTRISSEFKNLGNYQTPTAKKQYGDVSIATVGGMNLVYFTCTTNGAKYDLAFPFEDDTLYIGSFYISNYMANNFTAQSHTQVMFLSCRGGDTQEVSWRYRNIVVSSFDDLPVNAKLMATKAVVSPSTGFNKNSIFSNMDYIKYYVLCFDTNMETYEIGFRVNPNKYFYPTVVEQNGDILQVYADDGNRYKRKYYADFTRVNPTETKSSLSNSIVAFYMNDKPDKLSGNGVWAAKNSGSNSWPVRYLGPSQNCYFKLVIKANTEKDPANVNAGTWKDFTICSSKFDKSFKNAMVRENKTWKRWDGYIFELGNDIKAYNASAERELSAAVHPVRLLSAGATISSDEKLYEVQYKKLSTWNNIFAIGDPCLYVYEGRLYDGSGKECALGDPFADIGSPLIAKFASSSLLEEHEGGAIENFYTCGAGVITYGIGLTWQVAKKYNEDELVHWKNFFREAKKMSEIKISLLHPSLTEFNTGSEKNNAPYVLTQTEADGQIYFRKTSNNELVKNVYPHRGSTLLPFVHVDIGHIRNKFETVVIDKAKVLYDETIKPIETIKSSNLEELANVDFERWIADTNGLYTIRSKITQLQWDYLVDAKFQGNPSIFRYIRGGKDPYQGVKCTYRKFCENAVAGIEYYNQNQRNNPSESFYLRSSAWRNGPLKRVFTNIPPEEAEPSADNTRDTNKYYVHDITISCHSLGRGKVDTVMLENDSGRNVNPRSYITFFSKEEGIDDNSNDAVYYLTSYFEEDSRSSSERAVRTTSDAVDWGRFKDIINKWSCVIKTEARKNSEGNPVPQALVGVDRYYDFYTGMTPFVQAYFRDGVDSEGKAKKWNILNSVQHPYFKSLVVEDKGVKTATLTLFDKDFGSYQYGIVVTSDLDNSRYTEKEKWADNTKSNHTLDGYKQVYSLETIIKKALVQNFKADTQSNKSKVTDKDSGGNSYEGFTEEELKDTYLKYDKYRSADATNLRIRFGYADDNPPVKSAQFKGGEDEARYKSYNDQKYGGNENNKRDYRWYDVKNPGKEKSMEVIPKSYYDGEQINQLGEDTDIRISSNDTRQIDNTLGAEVNEEDKLNTGLDLTTLKSYVRNYMIIGYETSLKTNGIQYTIKAVETGYASLMKKRFLQRYHELTSNPVEVLAALMTIFNEPQEGKPNKKSGFKIYYAKAPEEKNSEAADTINMLFDFGGLSDEDREKYSWAKDSYTAATNGGLDANFGREIYKKITVKLGGESALGNMAKDRNYGKPALYKSVSSLMDEFCAACPSKKFGVVVSDAKAYDKDGNEITNDSYESQARLGWFLGKYESGGNTINGDEMCIVLYYKRPRKLGRIRVYRWGPDLPYKTVVKSLSVKNNNEFAILSAVDTFESGTNGVVERCKINSRNSGIASANDSETKLLTHDLAVVRGFKKMSDQFDTEGAEIVGYPSSNPKDANGYDLAFSSCMYTGTMEIMGDPSLEFNMLLQPYTYPIRLEVYVPRNELSLRAIDWKISDSETMNDKIQKIEKDYGARENVGYHQVHEMSGYYVITSITHNISPSGYTTTLGIASYPNIEKDVLDLDSEKKPIQPIYISNYI